MASHFSKGPWRVERTTRTHAHLLQIKNGHRDPIAVVYTSEADARLMAAAPRLLRSLKQMVDILDGRRDLHDLQAGQLIFAEALIDEVKP